MYTNVKQTKVFSEFRLLNLHFGGSGGITTHATTITDFPPVMMLIVLDLIKKKIIVGDYHLNEKYLILTNKSSV